MRRSARSMILMAAAACLTCAGPFDRFAHAPQVARDGQIAARLEPAQIDPTSTFTPLSMAHHRPTRSLALPRTWHYRLKSVLESKDGLGFVPIDLGPAEFPGSTIILLLNGQTPVVSLPRIPLRC